MISGSVFYLKLNLLTKWKLSGKMNEQGGLRAVTLLFKCWNKNWIEF